MLRFNRCYFFLAILLFTTEVIIGIYFHDAYIRPYGGDVLIGILIYCTIKSFLNYPVTPLAIAVLLFCYLVEILQYFHFVDRIGFGRSKIACIILGTSFSWVNMLCYTVGILLILLSERLAKAIRKF